MKKDTHPKYEKAQVECSCGNKFETRSTISHIHVELCSKCHPFYTGTQKLIDTAGRIDKFKERMKKAEEHKKKKIEKPSKKTVDKKAKTKTEE
ncbi:50S ribosomal protein L31 [bacterium CG_4_10_14_0_2_um_filter_33_32]|nr:MAG: 50S ribosomal protein L31 [bacterium CG2_30_33_46]PIR67596.1 MAG: 50S ribosomal protein L31 [bacterium CG10_big_fil_rev_8_21_14_0_10_33_18]PIU77151.1 MAG: 50S ribosomal protein L31 [bacterium CG06_land_8_20_14_3_00_33_50]PIW81372.1 MAG: 50S ribosomal protein L31 [bacterium CG_4_8_14_3_um_filter_33_28]PIY85171.1 MAG: 50S ribosomal protein L31 [bacterium CG_4_10_14_0_8_um_filter_33_57]PIZ85424.1 MAG: 50S ribosomal protein L31 [bacterium CG_4_10_14_0_2_um_filter_33_32]PJA72491.1 MAG: 50S